MQMKEETLFNVITNNHEWKTVKRLHTFTTTILNHCIQINSASSSDLYFSRLKSGTFLASSSVQSFKNGNIKMFVTFMGHGESVFRVNLISKTKTFINLKFTFTNNV